MARSRDSRPPSWLEMYDTQRMMKDSSADTTHTIPGGERTLSQVILVTQLNLDTIIRDEVPVETEEDVTDAEEEDHDDDLE